MSAHTRILRRDFTGKISLKTTDHCKTKSLLTKFSPRNSTVVSRRGRKTLWNGLFFCELENVLSPQECAEIVKNGDECIFEDMSEKYRFGKQRNSSRLLVLDKSLAGNLWRNIEPVLSRKIEELELSKQPLGFDVTRGEWELHGLNEAMRISKYSGKNKEYFGPHKDAQYCPNGDQRSLFTMLVYLNHGFRGGETCFYFPKDSTLSTKGMTTKEEIDTHGGIKNGFNCLKVVPKVGNAVLFSQSILHESLPVHKDSKYVLKTDVVVKRHSKQFGFAVTDEEKDDYLTCLNYFREAQQEELLGNFEEASDLYERALSIRYCYPNSLVTTVKDPVMNGDKETEKLPLDVWQHIFKYLPGHDAQNLVYAYPQLNVAKECWERHERNNTSSLFSQSYLPKINYHKGIITRFEFPDADFFRENVDGCCRVAAMYSFFLLGHKPEDDVYTVRYNPDTQEVCAVALETLLTDVFYNRRCYGSFYNVRQQDPKVKDPKKDFEACVDRNYMLLRHGAQFLGVELPDSFYVKSSAYTKSGDQSGEDDDEDDDEDEDEGEEEEEEGDEVKKGEIEEEDDQGENDQGEDDQVRKRDKEEVEDDDDDDDDDDDHKMKEICDGSVPFYGEIDRSLRVDSLIRMFIRMQDGSRVISELESFDGDVDIFEIVDEEEAPGNVVFFQILRDIVATKSKVSCTLVSKLKEPLQLERDSVCICFLGPEEEMLEYLGDSCTTEFYNHLVFDFEGAQLLVKQCSETANCCDGELLHPYNFENISNEQKSIGCGGKAMFYEVNIEPVLSSSTSFNHASCQCGNPRFEVHE